MTYISDMARRKGSARARNQGDRKRRSNKFGVVRLGQPQNDTNTPKALEGGSKVRQGGLGSARIWRLGNKLGEADNALWDPQRKYTDSPKLDEFNGGREGAARCRTVST